MMVSEKDFNAELSYRTVMNIAKRMLSEGIISSEELSLIDTIMLEKYRPFLGMLMSGKNFCDRNSECCSAN